MQPRLCKMYADLRATSTSCSKKAPVGARIVTCGPLLLTLDSCRRETAHRKGKKWDLLHLF